MKKIILAISVLVFLIIPCNAYGKNTEFVIGVTSGYSFLSERDYYEGKRYDSENKWENKLGFHAGANVQYSFSKHWTIQVEIDYQRRTHFEEYVDYAHPEFNYSRTENTSFSVYYLNAIYRLTNKKENFSLYFLSGIGIVNTEGSTLFSKIGLGIKYAVSSKAALNLGISFWPGPIIYGGGGYGVKLFHFYMDYVSLNVGLEYGF